MAASELLYVTVVKLLRNKYASILRVMSYNTCQNCHDFYFVLDIFLSLTAVQAINIDIAMAITLVRVAEELTQY